MRSDFWSLPYAAQQAIRRGEHAETRARRASYRASEAADVCGALVEALTAMVCEKVDYMQINSLGDPEAQHTIKMARAALAKARGEA